MNKEETRTRIGQRVKALRLMAELSQDELRLKGKDLEVIYDNKLKEAIKQSSPTDEKLTESIDVVL